MLGAAAGGLVLYLIQSFLTVTHVSVFQMNVVNGVILIAALGVNGLMERWRRRVVERPDASKLAPA
jgi:ribose/xylose/arabinose/galactoside ABC-type transport system permease subunit